MSATETCFNKPRFSAACMLVSYLFSRSIGTCQYIAVVSFAENGRFSGQTRMLGKERSWWWYDYSMNTISHDSETPAQGQQVITACAFLHHSFDGSMKVFLPKRADTKKFLPGIYELPGGHIDFGEDFIAGLKREVQEEFGLKCSVGDPCAAFTYTNEVKGSHSIEVIFFAQFTDQLRTSNLTQKTTLNTAGLRLMNSIKHRVTKRARAILSKSTCLKRLRC